MHEDEFCHKYFINILPSCFKEKLGTAAIELTIFKPQVDSNTLHHRGGSRTAATSKMECFVIIVNGFQPLTIITKRSILDVAAVLDPPLSLVAAIITFYNNNNSVL